RLHRADRPRPTLRVRLHRADLPRPTLRVHLHRADRPRPTLRVHLHRADLPLPTLRVRLHRSDLLQLRQQQLHQRVSLAIAIMTVFVRLSTMSVPANALLIGEEIVVKNIVRPKVVVQKDYDEDMRDNNSPAAQNFWVAFVQFMLAVFRRSSNPAFANARHTLILISLGPGSVVTEFDDKISGPQVDTIETEAISSDIESGILNLASSNESFSNFTVSNVSSAVPSLCSNTSCSIYASCDNSSTNVSTLCTCNFGYRSDSNNSYPGYLCTQDGPDSRSWHDCSASIERTCPVRRSKCASIERTCPVRGSECTSIERTCPVRRSECTSIERTSPVRRSECASIERTGPIRRSECASIERTGSVRRSNFCIERTCPVRRS
uniref:EGF-like domain-containing protein n=1 Tax=Macrostomum lignano TaxID=282301 RepID=A0A1I8HM67_9PLAT